MQVLAPQVRLAATARQASLLVTSSYVLAGFGFIFWTITARLFNATSVGLAATTISLASLVSSFSLLGTDFSLIRFLPTARDPGRLARQGLWFVTLVALVASLVVILVLGASQTVLGFAYLPFLFLVATLNTLSTMISTIFIALRENRFNLLKALGLSIAKLAFLPILVAWGGLGIALGYSLGLMLGIAIGFVGLKYLRTNVGTVPLAQPSLRSLASFSALNFGSVIGFTTVDRIAPALILLMLGPPAASYFYISYTISQLLYYVPEAFSRAIFAEGSAPGQGFETLFRRSLARTLVVLVPAAFTSPIWAPLLLGAVGGPAYAGHWPLLALLSAAIVPLAIIEFLRAFLNVKSHPASVVLLAMIYGTVTFVAFAVLLYGFGSLEGTGIAWVISGVFTVTIGYGLYRRYNSPSPAESEGSTRGQYRSRTHYTDPEVAATYDDRRFATRWGKLVDRLEKRALGRALTALPPGAPVCEVACGTGRMTQVLLLRGHPTLASDVSAGMAGRARARLNDATNVRGFVLCDASQLPFRSNSFEAVVAFRFIAHLPPEVRTAVLSEAARVSRSTVLISAQTPWAAKFVYRYVVKLADPVDPPYAIAPRKLKRELRRYALKVDSVFHALPLIAETYVARLRKV